MKKIILLFLPVLILSCTADMLPVKKTSSINIKVDGKQIKQGETIDLGVLPTNVKKDFNFVIENDGNAELELTGSPVVSLITEHTDNISMVQPLSASITPKGSSVFTLSMIIGTVNTVSAQIIIKSNDVKNSNFTYTIKVASEKPKISILNKQKVINLNDTYDYSFVDINTAITEKFIIKNTGNIDLVLNGQNPVTLSGQSVDYSVLQPAKTILLKDETTDFTIISKSDTTGIKSEILTIASNDPENTSFSFFITSNVVSAPRLNLTINEVIQQQDSEINLGDISIGGESNYFNVIINNPGTQNLVLSGTPMIDISGADKLHFEVSQPSLSTISPKGNTSFRIKFTPFSLGIKNIQLSITSNSPDYPVFTINMKGNCALKPDIGIFQDTTEIINAGSYDFGLIEKGKKKSVTFTIKNKGAEQLSLTSIPYIEVQGDGTFGVTIQPIKSTLNTNETTSFTIEVAPVNVGIVNATVVIKSNDTQKKEFKYILKIEAKENTLGTFWKRVAVTTPFVGRSEMVFIEFKGKLWGMGGE